MKKALVALVIVGTVYVGYAKNIGSHSAAPPVTAEAGAERSGQFSTVQAAYSGRKSGVQVQGEGVVAKVLADDKDGSRHQRFIVSVAGGRTILIAHNIDLAPRVASLKAGDSVAFNGEYEWNAKGGIVHWTHRDPSGRHAEGWLKHDGRVYQ